MKPDKLDYEHNPSLHSSEIRSIEAAIDCSYIEIIRNIIISKIKEAISK